MKILFINRHTGSRTVPLASACLAAELENRFGAEAACSIMELPPGFSVPESAAKIAAMRPSLICLTLYSWSREDLLTLAAALPNAFSGEAPPVIAGGPEVSGDPEGIQSHPAVTLAVSGEGEEAVTAIVEVLQSPNSTRDAQETRRLSEAFPAPYRSPLISDLNSLSSPWTSLDLAKGAWDDFVWEIVRGCPFSCHFCFESKGGNKVRRKNLERVEEELNQLLTMGARKIFVLDPTFNASPVRAKELLELFLAKAPNIEWHLEVRAEFLDDEQAALYAALGCTLQIGLQTAHPNIAAAIGRPFDPEDFTDKVFQLHQEGVSYGLDLIYGLPGDSLKGFQESLDFALGCAPNHLDMFPLAVLPGTRLRDDAESMNLPFIPVPPYTVTGTDTFPADDLDKATKLAEAANRFYNAGRAVPWFLSACEILELSPSELIIESMNDSDFRTETTASAGEHPRGNDSGDAESAGGEAERPRRIAAFLRRLAESRGRSDIAGALADGAALLTVESAHREQMPLPGALELEYDPAEMMNHMEMGIGDPAEWAAFVPRAPGRYSLIPGPGGLSFEESPE